MELLNDFSGEEALKLTSNFLTREWKLLQPEDVEVIKIQSGFNNSVYIVKRLPPLSDSWKEPAAVIIRKYGGRAISEMAAKKDLRPCTQTEELLIVQALAHQKLMPELIGLFDGGRIEEFIECRQITAAEAIDPQIMPDLAKNMARIHGLKVPLPKPAYNFADALRKNWNSYLEENPTDRLEKHDFSAELDWLEPLLHPDRHRIVLMNWDTHFLNISIRKAPKEGELKTVIFDFEMAGYNIRGKDLGLLFLAIGGGLNPPKITFPLPFKFPDIEICKSFIDLYLEECELLFDDIDRNGVDSYEHVMIESLLGAMVSVLCFMFVQLRSMAQFAAKDAEFAEKFVHMGELMKSNYFECKNLMQEQFPNYRNVLACPE